MSYMRTLYQWMTVKTLYMLLCEKDEYSISFTRVFIRNVEHSILAHFENSRVQLVYYYDHVALYKIPIYSL